MAWTLPRSWVAGELITATIMNEQIRDNMDALKDPPSEVDPGTGSTDYTTTSATFVDIDSTDFTITLATTGGDVFVFISGGWNNSAGEMYVDIVSDAVSLSRDGDGFSKPTGSSGAGTAHAMIPFLETGLSSGSHTYKPQWKISGGNTAKLFNGQAEEMNPVFMAREMS